MASRDRDKFRSHPSGHQKWLKKSKVKAFMQKQRGCFEKFISKKNKDLLGGLETCGTSGNLVNKNDGIKNTNMDCEIREVTNINENITGLENVKNLTPPLDVQDTHTILNDRCVYDLSDPGCWPS
ncbi:zinc finger MYM-type protein 1-like [Aphis craccivora]|uniref:Zinc finger MYM-type protein 1-like n=1 Tax=Aphis craccivora TaxID=307492 RepID=A0A6G0VT09_APHCR|nr:zinc finger MYM-type protein 1-like [Aphis craccivora]